MHAGHSHHAGASRLLSQFLAVSAISPKIGSIRETLNVWVRQAKRTATRATVSPVLHTVETLKVPLFQAQWQTRQVRREAEPDARCAVARLMAGMGLRTIVRGKVAKNNNPRRFRAMAADVTPRILQDFPLLHHEEEDDWQRWFDDAGTAQPGFAKGLNFSDLGMVLHAAARGLMIRLGSQ